MKQFLYLCLFLFMVGCETNTSTSETTDNPTIKEATTVEDDKVEPVIETTVDDIDSSFNPKAEMNYIYHGSLGLYQNHIALTLQFDGEDVTGSYYYSRHQKTLNLTGKLDRFTGKVTLTESYKNQPTGYFNCTISDSSLEGNWSANKEATDKNKMSLKRLDIYKTNPLEKGQQQFVKYTFKHKTIDYSDSKGTAHDVSDNLNICYLNDQYFSFYYSIVGGNFHTGSIDGMAKRSASDQYIFSIKGEVEEEACKLVFDFKNNTVSIESEGCSYYHGARARFGGTLTKQ